MSKYIPGNQKHLTLKDHVFIENSLNQNHTFKISQNTYAKIRPPSLRRSRPGVPLTGIIKAPFTMPRTSAFTGLAVEK